MSSTTIVGICNAAAAGDLAAVRSILQEAPQLMEARYPGQWRSKHAHAAAEKPVHVAAAEDQPEVVTFLLKDSENVEAPFGPEWKRCVRIATVCDSAKVLNAIASQMLSRVDADPHLVLPLANGGFSLLHESIATGFAPLFRGLLERNADILAKDRRGITPLHLAVQHSSSFGPIDEPDHPTKLLLSRGAEVDLWCAAGMNDLARAHALLSKDKSLADEIFPNLWDDGCGYPLNIAVKHGHYEMVKLLLEHGANPEAPDDDSYGAPVHAATENKQIDIAHLLLDHGSDPSKNWMDGDSNLAGYALLTGDQKLINRIYAMGGRPEIFAYVKAGNLPVIAELLDHCSEAPTLRPGFRGHPPLEEVLRNSAVSQCNADVLQLALQANPEIGPVVKRLANGIRVNKPWMFDFEEHKRILTMLLEHAKEYIGDNDFLPLHTMCSEVYNTHPTIEEAVQLAELFLDAGVDIDRVEPETHQTALYLAAANGHHEFVQLLLNRGANPTIRSKLPDERPLDAAQRVGFAEVAMTMKAV